MDAVLVFIAVYFVIALVVDFTATIYFIVEDETEICYSRETKTITHFIATIIDLLFLVAIILHG